MHTCPETHINKIFAEAVFIKYRQKRYGIKGCNLKLEPEYLSDLKELFERTTEIVSCGQSLGSGCSLTTIKEKIKTL